MGIDAEMLVKTRDADTSERRLRRLSYELCAAVGPKHFLLDREGRFSDWRKSGLALYVVDTYEQDGPTILPEPGEVFVRVYLMGRYYGQGYERGSLPVISAIADWCEARLPGEVWYGGDSSGVLAERWRSVRTGLWDHWIKVGNRPYYGSGEGGRSFIRGESSVIPRCKLCHEPFTRSGFGGQPPNEFYGCDCDGCGFGIISRDGGRTWFERKSDFDGDPAKPVEIVDGFA